MTKENVAEEAQGTAAGQTLSTKSAMMSGILAAIGTMTHEQMMQWFPDALTLAASIGGNQAAQNAGTLQMKPSDANPVQEDVVQLFRGESLSEEAQNRINVLVEHAVSLQVSIERERLQEEFQEKLVEETARVQEEIVQKIDSYATYAAEQWVEKNEVAIESALKVTRAERLMEGLVRLVAECSLDVPEDHVGVMEEMEARVAELESKLDEQVESAVELRTALVAEVAKGIFREVAEGLTPIQSASFKKLIEDVNVDVEPESLRNKITIIREAHFRKDQAKPAEITESVTEEGTAEVTESHEQPKEDPRITLFSEAISRASNNRYSRGPYTAR